MAFERKTWIDRQAEFPARRKLAPTGTADVYDVSREEGLILEEGDPFNASTMNNLEDRISKAVVMDAVASYSDGAFTLSGLPDNLPDIFTVRFKAPADFAEGDTFSINALPYALFMPNQQPAQAGAFAANAVVSLNVDLVAGKAFLAGGGGSAGEWEEIGFTASLELSGSPDETKIYLNKALGLVTFNMRFTVNVTNTPTDMIISLATPKFIFNESPYYISGVTGAGGDKDGKTTYFDSRLLLDSGNFKLIFGNRLRVSDGGAPTSAGYPKYWHCLTFYLPPEYWI